MLKNCKGLSSGRSHTSSADTYIGSSKFPKRSDRTNVEILLSGAAGSFIRWKTNP